MPKTQSFNSNSEIYADCWKISGLDLQVAQRIKFRAEVSKKALAICEGDEFVFTETFCYVKTVSLFSLRFL